MSGNRNSGSYCHALLPYSSTHYRLPCFLDHFKADRHRLQTVQITFTFFQVFIFFKTQDSCCIFKIYISQDAVSKSLVWRSGPHTSPASSLLPLKASVNIQFLEAVDSPSTFTYLSKCLHFFALKPLSLKASSNM